MNFVVATACIKMKMTPEEAINAATINGAYAMGIQTHTWKHHYRKKANLIITINPPTINCPPHLVVT
jgi:imidazolonepropionase